MGKGFQHSGKGGKGKGNLNDDFNQGWGKGEGEGSQHSGKGGKGIGTTASEARARGQAPSTPAGARAQRASGSL